MAATRKRGRPTRTDPGRRIVFYLPEKLELRLRHLGVAERTSLSALGTEAIKLLLADRDKNRRREP